MKNNNNRMLLLLSALLLSNTLLSCGSDTGKTQTSDTGKTDNTAAVTEEPTLLDQLPTVDYGGFVVNVHLQNTDYRNLDIMHDGEETGDLLNDLVYQRNRAVEEKYNVEIVGTDAHYDDVNDRIRSEVSSGLNENEFFFTNGSFASTAVEGYCYDLAALPGVDLTQIWWDQSAVDQLSIDGKLYFGIGDISPTTLLTSACLAFNKRLFDNYDMEVPYQLVRDGVWTMDTMIAMVKNLSVDVNGDSQMVYNEDLFGLTAWNADIPYSLFYGAGGMLSAKDADGLPQTAVDLDQVASIYDKMYQLVVESNANLITDVTYYSQAYDCFTEGHAFFIDVTLQKIDLMFRDMKDDFGIIPMPKFDESQENYISHVNASLGFAIVPSSAQDPERAGTLLEALAVGAYEMITPSLYEVISKSRNVRDEESVEMVNLIIRNHVFDPIYIYRCDGHDVYASLLASKKAEIASSMERKLKAMTRSLGKIVTAYQENE